MIEFIADLWLYMRERKRYWLWPIIFVLVLLSVVLIATEGSAIAPLIYALF